MEVLGSALVLPEERLADGAPLAAACPHLLRRRILCKGKTVAGRELAARLHHSMEEFEVESKSRLEREAAILKRLADNESAVANRFDADRTEREKHYVELRGILEAHVRRRGKTDEKLKTKLNEDLARLKNSIAIESKIRWREDAELAAAMNGYVEKLQQSLYIVNSDIV